MKEGWLPIKGYEGFYEVSDLGNVRSLGRLVTDSKGRVNRYKGRILSAGVVKLGYKQVCLFKNQAKETHRIHRLVMQAFIGDPPEGKFDVAHGNGDTSDNRLPNLRYATKADNENDKKSHGTDNRGESHGMSKLTEYDVIRIRAKANLETTRALSREFSVSPKSIDNVISRRTWNHI